MNPRSPYPATSRRLAREHDEARIEVLLRVIDGHEHVVIALDGAERARSEVDGHPVRAFEAARREFESAFRLAVPTPPWAAPSEGTT